MSQVRSLFEAANAVPSWRRVPELADLTEIFEPGVQVCSWQRDVDPGATAYLSSLDQKKELQIIESCSPTTPPTLSRFPDGPGRNALVEDLALLSEIVRELLGCSEAGLRLARVGRAMCPGWHIDRVGIRLVCTYQGSGTEWLDDQDVDRFDLQSDRLRNSPLVQASPGEIVLLKGALWQENEAFGAVHRSPEPGVSKTLRTLVTVDPLWRE